VQPGLYKGLQGLTKRAFSQEVRLQACSLKTTTILKIVKEKKELVVLLAQISRSHHGNLWEETEMHSPGQKTPGDGFG